MISPAADAPPRHPLDSPTWAALAAGHARFAIRHGAAARYPSDVTPFAALDPRAGTESWRDLGALLAPGELVAFLGFDGSDSDLPDGWSVEFDVQGVQMVDTAVRAEVDAEAVRLGPANVPEMLDLVERTQPGPFRPRTVELGGFYGIRRAGRLVAMAGERLRPPGWCEISAVCTDPDLRGQGLASRLVRTVAAGIRARGETPFLHAAATNTGAIRLYESMGFALRREVRIVGVAAA